MRDNLRVQPGERVLIEVRSDAVPYAELIAFEVFKVGGVATVLLESDDLMYQELMVTPFAQLSFPRQPQIAAIEAADYIVTIGLFNTEPARFRNLPAERVQAHKLRHQARTQAIYGKSGLKALVTDYPTRYMAQAFGVPWLNFFDMFWRAMDIDYGQLRERAAALAEILERGEQVHIQTPRGTDLRLRRGKRTVFRDDGLLRRFGNLPAGELYFAPIEELVEGRVVSDRPFHKGQRISLLELRCETGIAEPVDALEGFDIFMAQWDMATGDKNRLGQMGIGLNSEVRPPTGFRLTDQKIFGTVHLSLGTNEIMGGKNRSSLYWTMLLLQPTIIIDEMLILDKGRFVFL